MFTLSQIQVGTGLAMSPDSSGITVRTTMQSQTTNQEKHTLATIWQPICAIGGAVILGIVLPMIKGCQERTLMSQQKPVAPSVTLTDDAAEVASTKR